MAVWGGDAIAGFLLVIRRGAELLPCTSSWPPPKGKGSLGDQGQGQGGDVGSLNEG